MKGLKRGQFDFVWIFAILAGGAILALAIWGAVKTGDTLRYASDTEVGKSVSILTDPMQAGFAEASYGKIIFQRETRINNICVADGFGQNDISVATKSGVGEEWNLAGGKSSVHNKYIFSKEDNQGEEYYVFSKPFDFPYEIGDLIFLSSGRYCFLNAPDEVVDEVSSLGVENIVFDECGVLDEKVCFGRGGSCDVIVYGSCSGDCESVYDYGTVSRKDGDLKYVGSLMWGAVFGDVEVYECNIERLMFRASRIADIFAEKADLMNARNCGTNLKADLVAWSGLLDGAGSDDLISLKFSGDDLQRKNDLEVCGAW